MRRFMLLAALLAATAVAAQTPPQRIRGDVVTIDGTALVVKSRTGETMTVKLADNYAVVAVVAVDRAKIAEGAFIGTAAMPQPDGTFSALEVLVFPEASRGSNEGHGPWDLRPGSTMTNATIAQVVRSGNEQRLTLRYKDGEKTVVVPEGVPVVTFEPGERAMLVPGAHIMITASRQGDGPWTAARVLVGKDGLVPPM